MIWIDFNPQAGREMRDIHPLMVLSPRDANGRPRAWLDSGVPVRPAWTRCRETAPPEMSLRNKDFQRLSRLLVRCDFVAVMPVLVTLLRHGSKGSRRH